MTTESTTSEQAITTIVEVPFDGDTLAAVREGDEVFVVVKRVCEALGIDLKSQHRRLKSSSWASVVMMTMDDSSGRRRPALCIPLKRLSMWLATFDAGRVAEHVRPKIERYQREAADALHAYFFGQNALRALDNDQAARVELLEAEIAALYDKISTMEVHVMEIANGTISGMHLRLLRGLVRMLSELELEAKRAPSKRSAVANIYNDLRVVVEWGGAGQAWKHLPANKVHLAFLVLRRRESSVRRELGVRAEIAQIELPFMSQARHGLTRKDN